MAPEAERLFAALRRGEPMPEISLAGVPPSPATIPVAVIDAGSGGIATEVQTLLGNSGFDVSPGIWDAERIPKGIKGTTIVLAPGADAEASVVAAYLPGVKVVESAALRDASVAVVVNGAYELPGEGTGGSGGGGGGAPAECPVNAT
jgi:hypothetical protein